MNEFQAFAKVQLTSFLFWDVMWHMLIAGYWNSGTIYCSHLHRSSNQKLNTRKPFDNSTPRDWTPCILHISNTSILAKASISWRACRMQMNGFSLHWKICLCEKSAADFDKKLLPFHDTWLDFATSTNTQWATWEIPSNYVINNAGAKSIVMKTEGNEKI
jgi:hypothetical protein